MNETCPLCASEQVTACIDANNPAKSFAKCRMCACSAPLKAWNRPRVAWQDGYRAGIEKGRKDPAMRERYYAEGYRAAKGSE